MTDRVRPATAADVPAMVALSGLKRREYASYQPVFWREAEDSDAKQALFFRAEVERGESLVRVFERDGRIVGFVIAAVRPAPPVYNPGGLTCLIDDFAVEEPDEWATAGRVLLEAVFEEARARGAVQSVIVCGHRDEPKREFLQSMGLSIASEWYTGSI